MKTSTKVALTALALLVAAGGFIAITRRDAEADSGAADTGSVVVVTATTQPEAEPTPEASIYLPTKSIVSLTCFAS